MSPEPASAPAKHSSTTCRAGFDTLRRRLSAHLNSDPGKRRARPRKLPRTRPGPDRLAHFSLGDVAGLCHAYRFSVEQAGHRLRLFAAELGFRLVSIGEVEFSLAMDAYDRFGKGRHPAKLNMGDCYAYACAKTNHASLLFKGNDFTKTDIQPTRRPG